MTKKNQESIKDRLPFWVREILKIKSEVNKSKKRNEKKRNEKKSKKHFKSYIF